MKWTRLRFVVAILAISLTASTFAQSPGKWQEDLSLSEVRQARARAEVDPSLSEALRTRILELYDAAISSLEKAVNLEEAANEVERDRGRIDGEVASLKTQLARPEPPPDLPLPDGATMSQAEDTLARERARLAAKRAALRQQERLAEDRAAARNDISQRLGELDLELELLGDELRRQANSTARSELKEAARVSILSRHQAIANEIALLRSRLVLLNDQSRLVPLETDLV